MTKKMQRKPRPRCRFIFKGIKGRLPVTDRELEESLASNEGKAATMFAPKSATRWGDGRS